MGCSSSKAAVAPQKVVEAWRSQEERKPSGPSTSETIQVRENHTTPAPRQKGEECSGNSKAQRIELSKPLENKTGGPHVVRVQEVGKKAKDLDNASASSDSSTRISSAGTTTSKDSTDTSDSHDSGLGDEYAKIITEKSAAKAQEAAKVPEELEAPNLTIEGQRLTTPAPLGHRKRVVLSSHPSAHSHSTKESDSLPSVPRRVTFAAEPEIPDSPNIVKCPSSRGGVAFDIHFGEKVQRSLVSRRRPPALKRLEQSKRDSVTLDLLQEKQRVVEQRRKELEQQLLGKIRAQQEKDKQVQEALAKFAAVQSEKAEKKTEATTQNREAYLKALRDRLREKSQCAEVRNTKKLAPPQPQTFSTEDTPAN